MLKTTINPNDFRFDLRVSVDARNCRQLAIRLLATLATLAIAASRVAALMAAAAG